jgi:hypothetical protein
MFTQPEPRPDMDNAFHHAREVLRFLATNSPQAEHYYEILTAFDSVIQQQRQTRARGGRSKNRYVDQILTFDAIPTLSRTQSVTSPSVPLTAAEQIDGLTQGTSTTNETSSIFNFNESDFDLLPLDGSGGFDFGMFGWDNIAMQMSENFIFEDGTDWSGMT